MTEVLCGQCGNQILLPKGARFVHCEICGRSQDLSGRSVTEETFLKAEETRKNALYETARKRLPGDKVVHLNAFPYEDALRDMESLKGFRDSEELLEKAEYKIAQLKEEEARAERIRTEQAQKKKKRILLLAAAPFLFAALVYLFISLLLPGARLLKARSLIDRGQYAKAYETLKRLSSNTGREMLEEVIPLYKKQLLDQAEAGSYIVFGTYEQDNKGYNGKELLEWQILEKQEGKMLLITRCGIDCQPFEYKNNRSVWESSTLRIWLNGDFMEEAFTAEERSMILQTALRDDSNPMYATDPGGESLDYLFLLSIREAEEYFDSNEARRCPVTAYARAGYAYQSDEKYCRYWLRSPGASSQAAACVNSVGYISLAGDPIGFERNTVRPVMWITLKD